MPFADLTFQPSWWCRGGHRQTILPHFLRPTPQLSLQEVRIETQDGDFLDLDILEGPPESPWVVIFHGLEGSSQVSYVCSLMGHVRQMGWRAAAVNFRGCGRGPNRLRRSYHSGKTDDVDPVLEYLAKKQKNPIFYLVGFSIGGNIVLKWLGEKSAPVFPSVKKAVVVSVPYDLAKSVEMLDKGFNREVYTRSLLTGLKKKTLLKEKMFPGFVSISEVQRCTTFKAFDGLVTGPLNGFRDAEHYWKESSSVFYLDKIRVPSLLIHAADDPFFPGNLFPSEIVKKSPYLTACLTVSGGHLGFVSGKWPWQMEPGLEKTILNFLKEA